MSYSSELRDTAPQYSDYVKPPLQVRDLDSGNALSEEFLSDYVRNPVPIPPAPPEVLEGILDFGTDDSKIDINKEGIQIEAADGSTRHLKLSDQGTDIIQESVTRNNKTESWSRAEKLENGNYIWTNDQDPTKKEERVAVTQRNGTLVIDYPNGNIFRAYIDGVERLTNQKEDWNIYYRNGQPEEIKYPDGAIRRFKFDGAGKTMLTVEFINNNGTGMKITREEDGAYKYKNFGSDEERNWNVEFSVTRDGTFRYVDKDAKGEIVTRYADGRKTFDTPATKTYTESDRNGLHKVIIDGKSVELLRDSDKKPNEIRDLASNISYKKNEQNEWVPSVLDASKPFKFQDNLLRQGNVYLDSNGVVNFINTDGRQVQQHPGEKGELLASIEDTIQATLSNDAMTASEKAELQTNILDYTKRNDVAAYPKAAFLESLKSFAERSNISEQEKALSYKELNRLLESKSDKVFSPSDRGVLAAQLAWHMGHPEKNAQGRHPTCQVTSIRSLLLYENPSVFARLMTDIITTGQFETGDKSIIKPPVDSFLVQKKSPESEFPPADGARTWMGKISDVTIANIHWQRQTYTPAGEAVQKGQISYREDLPTEKDDGTGLYKDLADGKRERLTRQDKSKIESPLLFAKDIASSYCQIMEACKPNVVVVALRRGGENVGRVVSEEELHNLLLKDNSAHIAQIGTGVKWVKHPGIETTDPEKNPGQHVVIIKDYDPATRTIAVDNSWGSKFDRLDPKLRINLHDLYDAMDEVPIV